MIAGSRPPRAIPTAPAGIQHFLWILWASWPCFRLISVTDGGCFSATFFLYISFYFLFFFFLVCCPFSESFFYLFIYLFFYHIIFYGYELEWCLEVIFSLFIYLFAYKHSFIYYVLHIFFVLFHFVFSYLKFNWWRCDYEIWFYIP